MTKISRLWRRLGVTEPLFRVWNEDGLEMNDHVITEMSIHRGSAGPDWGVHTQTLEFSSILYESVRTNQNVHVDLTDYGTLLLNRLSGASRNGIKPRFNGRIGKQSVEDRGIDGEHTTYSCATWEAQLKNLAIPVKPPSGSNVGSFVVALATTAGSNLPPIPTWHWPAPREYYGFVRSGYEPVTYSEGIDKWTADLGLYVQTARDGRNWVLPHQYRWEQALAKLDGAMPLTRSQAVSPATMEQPGESIPDRHQVLFYRNEELTAVVFGDQWDNPNIKLVRHDMNYVDFRNNDRQPLQTGNALGRQARVDRYRLPALTFNLLYLLTSEHAPHRDQARQLLELEAGDAVYLSADWRHQLRGVYFATGIDESISPDGWEITLNLSTARETVGYVSPDVPARTWESAGYPWADESRQWQNA